MMADRMSAMIIVSAPSETADGFAARLVALAYWHNGPVAGFLAAKTDRAHATIALDARPGMTRADVLQPYQRWKKATP